MIKKLIFLAVLAGLGYVGYLVWNNLTESEKAEFKKEAGKVVDKGKEVAKKAADKITETIREDKDPKDEPKEEEKSEKKSPPVPKQPGKITIPSQ